MKKKLRIYFLCLILLLSGFSSCVNSLDDLCDQYNENYKKNTILEYRSQMQSEQAEHEDETQKKPGDIDFNQDEMLFEEYFVYDDGTLNLAAPPDCYAYSWTVRDPSKGYAVVTIAKYWDGTTNASEYNEREFVIYIPDSGLEPKTYQLTLTLRDREGNKYEDVCGLIVYEHYNYKRDDGTTIIDPRDPRSNDTG